MVSPVVAAAAMWWHGAPARVPITFGVIAAMITSALARLILLRVRRKEPARARVEGADLVVGTQVFPRATLRGAAVFEQGDEAIVQLDRGLAPAVELVVPSLDAGRELLRALGLDAGQVTTRFWVKSRLATADVATLVVALVAGPLLGILVAALHSGAPLFVPVLAYLALRALPARVDVGADGVEYRWLGWKTFVSARDIASVDRTRMNATPVTPSLACVRILRRDGRSVSIPVGAEDLLSERAAALCERIREVVAASDGEAEAPSQLAREGRTVREWIESLRALSREHAYRTAGVSADALWALVEAPAGTAADRVAAAVAVARDDETRERVRVAAHAVAEPKLRVALEAAAEGDDDALENALDALETEAERPERRVDPL
jgi:hypothetical protein